MEEATRCYKEALADDPSQRTARQRLEVLTAIMERQVCRLMAFYLYNPLVNWMSLVLNYTSSVFVFKQDVPSYISFLLLSFTHVTGLTLLDFFDYFEWNSNVGHGHFIATKQWRHWLISVLLYFIGPVSMKQTLDYQHNMFDDGNEFGCW